MSRRPIALDGYPAFDSSGKKVKVKQNQMNIKENVGKIIIHRQLSWLRPNKDKIQCWAAFDLFETKISTIIEIKLMI